MTYIRMVSTQEELTAALTLRRTVFIDEQGVPEADELDGLDPLSLHFLALPEVDSAPEEAHGTARLFITPRGEAKAQRVAVRADARRAGIGRALMRTIEAEARGRGHGELLVSAQQSAVPFYEQLGYEAFGEPYDDAGIPHRNMRLAL